MKTYTHLLMLIIMVCTAPITWLHAQTFAPATAVTDSVVYSFDIQEITPFPSAVHGMTVRDDSTLYFSDTYKHWASPSEVYMLEYPYSGDIRGTGITGNGVAGLLWLNDELYVAVLNDSKIKKYDQDFNLLQTWNVTYPWNITTDGEQVFVVTYGGSVVMLTDSGIQTITTGLEYPFDIIYSGNNSFFISEQVDAGVPGRVIQTATDGSPIDTIPFSFKNPEGLSLDADQNLYICDTDDGVIYQHTPGGQTNIVSDEYYIPICATAAPGNSFFVNTNHSGGTLLLIDIVKDSIPSGIQTLSDAAFEIYPNPAQTQIRISAASGFGEDAAICIYNQNGSLISRITPKKQTPGGDLVIDLHHFPPGLYFVHVKGKDFSGVQKLIIQK